uniref:Uncharacterized protein n=1 Tax=Arundo donax TaxID=35708 RepID=A0A0A9DC18_ARUDO
MSLEKLKNRGFYVKVLILHIFELKIYKPDICSFSVSLQQDRVTIKGDMEDTEIVIHLCRFLSYTEIMQLRQNSDPTTFIVANSQHLTYSLFAALNHNN